MPLKSCLRKCIDPFWAGVIVIHLFCWWSAEAQGNLTGSNTAEFQLGNIPGTDPRDQTSLYDQLNLRYSIQSLALKVRVEQFYPSYNDGKNYTKLSQYSVKYTTPKLELNVGHLYSTLGRGLLLRTYEIPGAIWETRGYRVRYGFYRDLHGIEVGYKLKNAEIKALRGRVLDVALPPTLNDKERRPDLVEGMQFSYQFTGHKPGMIYMRHKNASEYTSYTSLFYSGNFGKNLSVYAELANRLNTTGHLISFTDSSGFAAYTSINYVYDRLGISVELKDYRNMSIGAGISDPPSLVKEHSYRLLNRATHVPLLTDESGYQVELFYRFRNNGMMTLNNSMAKNEIVAGNASVFREFFAEYQFPAGRQFSGSVFVDYAIDPLVNEDNRYTSGFSVSAFHQRLSSEFETELQYTERTVNETISFMDAFIAYTLSKGTTFSVTAILEFTNDPFQVEADRNQNFYPGISISYRPNSHHQFLVFLGKRRGGPACNSGVCYDVLDFEGVEIRLTSRF
jgi:hypothetical protein